MGGRGYGLFNQVVKEEGIHFRCSCIIVCCYEGKEDASNIDNYRGTKLLGQVIKVVERGLSLTSYERN